jgi:MFS transporter, UMF1 family
VTNIPESATGAGASRAGIVGWLLFDWASQPFYTLVTTFLFAPYFAAHVAPDPAAGQALWGFAAAAAGLVIALASPVLGAVADAAGARKPWIAAFSVLFMAGCFALWWAEPGGTAPLLPILVAFALATIGAEFATVFTNAMMPRLVPERLLGRLSGAGLAMGYAGGLVSFVVMLVFVVADPGTGRTLFGLDPVFSLDPVRHEGSRAAGPLSALWYAVFVLPLFLFTPDAGARLKLGPAAIAGVERLGATLREARRHAQAFTFLIAHMLYQDGLSALFVFGGIYAASVFGWPALGIGIFGLLITVSAMLGAALGGWLDDRIGPWRVVGGAVVAIVLLVIALLSVTRDRIFFVVPVAPASGGLFASTAERLYLGLGLVLGAVAGPVQSASRTYLARVAPRESITAFFGLYALSGKLTAFAAPLLVGVVTAWTGSQRLGIAVILVFFLSGLVLLRRAGPIARPAAI